MEKELQKTNQMDFRIEKVIKRKGDDSSINWEGYIIRLIAGYSPERYSRNKKIELE